ncbi:MAG: hypothetical protein K9M51_01565 [Candidatus Gracilibacteria bacterium]|nr:hypothetical protein [Candidatus Gracilibacteria bacterium]
MAKVPHDPFQRNALRIKIRRNISAKRVGIDAKPHLFADFLEKTIDTGPGPFRTSTGNEKPVVIPDVCTLSNVMKIGIYEKSRHWVRTKAPFLFFSVDAQCPFFFVLFLDALDFQVKNLGRPRTGKAKKINQENIPGPFDATGKSMGVKKPGYLFDLFLAENKLLTTFFRRFFNFGDIILGNIALTSKPDKICL